MFEIKMANNIHYLLVFMISFFILKSPENLWVAVCDMIFSHLILLV